MNALHWAAVKGFPEIVKALLDAATQEQERAACAAVHHTDLCSAKHSLSNSALVVCSLLSNLL